MTFRTFRYIAPLIATVLAVAIFAVASGQRDCTAVQGAHGIFEICYTPHSATATPTPTQTPTATAPATATTIPPTATALQPTATVTPTSTVFLPTVAAPGIYGDDFERAALGSDWTGTVGLWAIQEGVLTALNNTNGPMYFAPAMGADQHVSVKLVHVAPGAQSIGLVLKAQGPTYSRMLEVEYQTSGNVIVWGRDGSWSEYGRIGVTFASGDTFGVLAQSTGAVTVYKNGTAVGTIPIQGWAGNSSGGQAGIYAWFSGGMRLDNFAASEVAGTPSPTATAAPIPPTLVPTAEPTLAITPSAGGRTFYLSPAGNDAHAGTSAGAPWRTFAKAWAALYPGDTLVLLDGVYTASTTGLLQPNVRNGEPRKPITIRAQNDGGALLDGEGTQYPVLLGTWGNNGQVAHWFTVEGIVAVNGKLASIRVDQGHDNTFRRVSAYNADPDENSHVISLTWTQRNLVEDFIAAGTGRYMVNVFSGDDNTVRRGVAIWQRWDGRHFCGVQWPNGNNVGVYNSSNTTVENVIAYGRSLTGVFIQANSDTATASNNQILGSIAVLQGRDYDGSVWTFGTGQAQPTDRPKPTNDPYNGSCDNSIAYWEWGHFRDGFHLWGQGELEDNVYRDVLALDNMGMGWGSGQPSGPGPVRNVVDHATLLGNGASVPSWEAAQGGNIYIAGGEVAVTNSTIEGSSYPATGGARLQYRYTDRELSDVPLLPWPMDARMQAEVGITGTAIIQAALQRAAGASGAAVTWPVPALVFQR